MVKEVRFQNFFSRFTERFNCRATVLFYPGGGGVLRGKKDRDDRRKS